jgi:hypothetical protein
MRVVDIEAAGQLWREDVRAVLGHQQFEANVVQRNRLEFVVQINQLLIQSSDRAQVLDLLQHVTPNR